jgi:hypothetical protein
VRRSSGVIDTGKPVLFGASSGQLHFDGESRTSVCRALCRPRIIKVEHWSARRPHDRPDAPVKTMQPHCVALACRERDHKVFGPGSVLPLKIMRVPGHQTDVASGNVRVVCGKIAICIHA